MNFNGIQKPRGQSLVIAAIAVSLALFASPSYAGLDVIINNTRTFVISVMSLLNVLAGLAGGYFVFSGVMNWKKSSNEQGGGNIGFKEIVIPIISGIILVAFSGFIMMTSQTFGFASSNNLSNFN